MTFESQQKDRDDIAKAKELAARIGKMCDGERSYTVMLAVAFVAAFGIRESDDPNDAFKLHTTTIAYIMTGGFGE